MTSQGFQLKILTTTKFKYSSVQHKTHKLSNSSLPPEMMTSYSQQVQLSKSSQILQNDVKQNSKLVQQPNYSLCQKFS